MNGGFKTFSKDCSSGSVIFIQCYALFLTLMIAFGGVYKIFGTVVYGLFVISVLVTALIIKRDIICDKFSGNFIKISNFVGISFLVYFSMQSPVFDAASSQLLYWCSKAAVIIVCIFLIVWSRLKGVVFPLVAFVAFAVDLQFIKIINLGFSKAGTEWHPIWEQSIALLITYIFLNASFKNSNKNKIDDIFVAIFCIGHLYNYFAAGFAKVVLSFEHSWLLNETLISVPRAHYWGIFSFYDMRGLWEFVQGFELFSNISVLIGQILSALVVFLPFVLGPLTVFYDIFHIGVGLAAGVWFYKWIFVNILILRYSTLIRRTLGSVSFLVKILVFSSFFIVYYFGNVVHLGWWEIRQGDLVTAHYVGPDGDSISVHPMAFGSGSFPLLLKTASAFSGSTTLRFSTTDPDVLSLARDCSAPFAYDEHVYDLALRERMTTFAARFLQERIFLDKLMIAIQPYHIALPRLGSVHSVFGFQPSGALTFDMATYCFNDNYELTSRTVRDSFTILGSMHE